MLVFDPITEAGLPRFVFSSSTNIDTVLGFKVGSSALTSRRTLHVGIGRRVTLRLKHWLRIELGTLRQEDLDTAYRVTLPFSDSKGPHFFVTCRYRSFRSLISCLVNSDYVVWNNTSRYLAALK